jgi:general secretion pathway protein I
MAQRRAPSLSGAFHQRGLTLVEVLVALAILGLVAASIVGLIGQNTRFIADQEQRMLAEILVDNAMVDRLARGSPLERGERTTSVELAGRRWIVTSSVVETAAPGVVRIDIAAGAEGMKATLAKATTLKAEKP